MAEASCIIKVVRHVEIHDMMNDAMTQGPSEAQGPHPRDVQLQAELAPPRSLQTKTCIASAWETSWGKWSECFPKILCKKYVSSCFLPLREKAHPALNGAQKGCFCTPSTNAWGLGASETSSFFQRGGYQTSALWCVPTSASGHVARYSWGMHNVVLSLHRVDI